MIGIYQDYELKATLESKGGDNNGDRGKDQFNEQDRKGDIRQHAGRLHEHDADGDG